MVPHSSKKKHLIHKSGLINASFNNKQINTKRMKLSNLFHQLVMKHLFNCIIERKNCKNCNKKINLVKVIVVKLFFTYNYLLY